MHRDRIVRAHPVDHLQWPPAGPHEVCADDLEPVHRRTRFEDLGVMRPAQPHAKTERWKIRSLHRITRRMRRAVFASLPKPAARRTIARTLALAAPSVLVDVAALGRAVLRTRGGDPALALARVLALAAIARALACALPFAAVAADAFDVGRRRAAAVLRDQW